MSSFAQRDSCPGASTASKGLRPQPVSTLLPSSNPSFDDPVFLGNYVDPLLITENLCKIFQLHVLVLAVLGLRCCVRAFSSCSRWGLLSTVVFGLPLPGVSYCRPQDSAAWAQQFWHMGFVAPRHTGSSWTRDRTSVPCIARQILYLWTTREAPNLCKFNRISNRSKSNITQSPLSLKRQLRKSWLTDLVKRD